MIIPDSEYADSKAPTVRSEGSEAPGSPPPYAPSHAGRNEGFSDSKPLPSPPMSYDEPPSEYDAGPTGPTIPANLPPRCNNLVEYKHDHSVKGIWQVDTALSIPESLLAPLEEFDGIWNESDQKRRKKDKGKRRSSDSVPTRLNMGVRPNLLLKSKNGSVTGEVHVVSSDHVIRPGLVVAEGHNGSVSLEVRTYDTQPLRIFALSKNGSVRVKIPQSFEGAVIMSSHNGSVNTSDPLKSRMTTFSGASGTTRGFIGDWQDAKFGSTPSPPDSPSPSLDPAADPPLPTVPADPFTSWTGPLVHISSHNGSVHLSFVDETRSRGEGGGAGAGLSGAWKGFMSGLFGGGDQEERGWGRGGRGRRGGPWGSGDGPFGHGGGPFGRGGGPFGPGGGPFGPGGGPFGPGGGPFGHAGGPFGPGGGPFGHGGPFGRGGGPFGHHGGSFGRGGGPFSHDHDQDHERGGRRGSFGRRGRSSRSDEKKEDGLSDGKAPESEGGWYVEENENGYPLEKKGPV